MPELLAIAEQIASQAKPGEGVEAYVAWNHSTDIRVYSGEIESLSVAEASGIGVRVVVDGRQGFAYAGDLSSEAAREALAEARDNAGFATRDENIGLASLDGVAPVVLDLWRDELTTGSTKDKVGLAVSLDGAARTADPRVRQVVSSDYGDSSSETAIASSTGICATSRSSVCYLSTDLLVGESSDTQTGSGYSVGRSLADLDSDKAVRDAVERSARLLGATKPASARVSVVLDRRVAATLLSILAGTLSGEEVAKGRSLFAGRLGEEVSASLLTLTEDPTNPLAFGASSYDAEGLACRPIVLIEKGRLAGFLYDTYSARLADAVSTASAVRAGFKSGPGVGGRALCAEPGELSEAEIIQSVGDGLYVQEISGVHSGVNPVSGDFSVGAEGLMIRGGVLCEPVREITIASTIQRMLQQILYVGNDLEYLPSSSSGVTLAISDIALGGN